MRIALLLEIPHGTPLLLQELPSQRMLWLLLTQDMLSIFNWTPNSIQVQAMTGILHMFQLTTDTQRSMMEEPKQLLLLRPKPHQQVTPLRPSDGTNQLGINQDHQLHSETSPNSILDPAMTGTHHMFQPTTDIQRFMMEELRLPLP